MKSYICLILDKHCQVVFATIFQGSLEEITARVKHLTKDQDALGYEIWTDGYRVDEFYDCESPPSRVHTKP